MSHSLALDGTLNWASVAGPVPLWTWEIVNGIEVVGVTGLVVDPLVGAVVVAEPVNVVVVEVEPCADGFPLPQAARTSPAVAMPSITVPGLRSRMRS